MRVSRPLPYSVLAILAFALLTLFGAPAKGVAQASTSTVLSVSPACLQQGCVTTLTATVTSGGTAVHPGLVYFCAGTADCESGAPLGTAQLLANGTAILKVQIEAGEETLHAVFHGTKSYGKSASSPQIITIAPNAAGVVTTVMPPVGPSFPGIGPGSHIDFFQFTSTVTPSGPLNATGNVTFTDQSRGNALLSTTGLISPSPQPEYSGTLNLSGIPAAVQSGTKYTVTGDFNDDGFADVAVVDGNGVLSILLGDGTGGFVPGPAFNGATGAHGPPVVGDFNGDGKLDVAIPDSSLKKIHISLGKGDGTFTSPAAVNVGDAPLILYAGDFNNDGIPDLLSLGATADTKQSITILLGKGDATFTSLTPFPADSAKSVAIADFNQDGTLDLAYGLNGVVVAKGNGDGTFGAATALTINQPETFVIAGDFDGDGTPDIVYTGQQFVTFLRGNGNMTFTERGFLREYDLQNHYTPLVAGPYSGYRPEAAGTNDGVLKVGAIVVSNADYDYQTFHTYEITRDQGLVSLATAVPSAVTPYQAAIADFTGDGLPDILSFQTAGSGAVSGFSGRLLWTEPVTSPNNIILDAGIHNIVATYTGDAFHPSVSSAPTPVMGLPVAYGNGFTGETGLVANGSAKVQDGVIQLTDGGQFEAGSLFSPTRVGKSFFVTDFDFQLSSANADGLAFVFQANGPGALGSPGGGVGYGNSPGGGGPSITNSFAIVLDLHDNQGEGGNSVRLEQNGVTSPAGAVDLTPSGIDLHSGHTFHVALSVFNGGIDFWITDITATSHQVTFQHDFTLSGQLPFGMGYTGFTAATGATTSTAKIFNWSVEDMSSRAISVQYPRPTFPNGFPATNSGLSFRGGAGISGSAIQLTNGTQFAATSAFLSPVILLKYPPSYRTFSTDFDFVINGGIGDGFAFVLQSQGLGAVGPAGGGLGYGPSTPGGQGTGIADSMAIKFDLHDNAGETPNSTGLYLNGASPTVPSIDLTPSGIQLSSGHPFHAQITSDGTTLKLSLTDLVQYKVFTQVLYSGSNLAAMIPATPYAGFTAGTGATPSSIKILNWTWSSY